MSLQISGHTGLLGFFADPAAHSKSPFMYNTAFQKLGMDYVYLAFQIDQTSLADAIRSMRTLQMRGANVSMPNKTAVIQYLDDISTEARLCNAVNTIVNENGRLIGYNTDGTGAMLALSRGTGRSGLSPPGGGPHPGNESYPRGRRRRRHCYYHSGCSGWSVENFRVCTKTKFLEI